MIPCLVQSRISVWSNQEARLVSIICHQDMISWQGALPDHSASQLYHFTKKIAQQTFIYFPWKVSLKNNHFLRKASLRLPGREFTPFIIVNQSSLPFLYYKVIFINNNRGLRQGFVYILITRARDIWPEDFWQPARYHHRSTAYLWVENMTKANGLDVRMVSPCLYCLTADIVVICGGGWWWRWWRRWRRCYHGRDTLNTDWGLLTIPGLEAAQVYRVRRHPHMYTTTTPTITSEL